MSNRRHTYSVRLAVEGGKHVVATLDDVGRTGDRSLKRIEHASRQASKELGSLERRLASGFRAMNEAAGSYLSLDLAGQLVMQADAYSVLQTRIRTATKETGDYAKVSRRLFEISNQTGTALESTVSVFQSLARSAPELKTSNDQMLVLTETVQKLGVIGGATTEGMKNGLLQFSQGLSAGIFRAEEFNSLLENIPEVAVRIAKGMGISVGQLRKMVLEGKVLSRDVFKALVKQAPEINREFANIPISIARASTSLDNSFSAFLGKLDKAVGLTGTLAKGMERAASLLDTVSSSGAAGNGRAQFEALFKRRLAIAEQLKRHQRGIVQYSDRNIPFRLQKKLRQKRQAEQQRLQKAYDQLTAQLKKLQTENINRLEKAGKQKPPSGADTNNVRPITDGEKLTRSLREQVRLLQFNRRELAIQQALTKAHAQGIRDQDAAIRDLTGRLYDHQQVSKVSAQADKEQITARQQDLEVIRQLQKEHAALATGDRERFVSGTVERFSPHASESQQQEAERLAGALFDATKAEQERQRLMNRGVALSRSLRSADQERADTVRELNALLKAGAIDQKTHARARARARARAMQDANRKALESSREWSDGVRRALRDYVSESGNAARSFQQAMTRALHASEDAFVQWATTGKIEGRGLFNSLVDEALRAAYRMAVIKPLGGMFDGVMSSVGSSLGSTLGSFLVAHEGGVVGRDALPSRTVASTDATAIFSQAPRFHGGGLVPGEVPIIAQQGEAVLTPGQMRMLGTEMNRQPELRMAVNIHNHVPGVEARADLSRDGQGGFNLEIMVERMERTIARNIGRGEGLSPTLERRYGLSPAAGAYR
ncbi:MAG: tape measure protein [Magnetococcales bacterium]|nr:tape measure protein [Magnetococcales bacterium]